MGTTTPVAAVASKIWMVTGTTSGEGLGLMAVTQIQMQRLISEGQERKGPPPEDDGMHAIIKIVK